MRNAITVAGIMLAVTVVTPSLQAAESFDGLWAMTKKECRNNPKPFSCRLGKRDRTTSR
jgi:anaerobic C4-dicarboxylate transporter